MAEDGHMFGVLQAEPAASVTEADLAFLDAVASGLAVSLDRHYAFRREVELRRRAEELAAENEKLYQSAKRAIASRERLLGVVSHDLKTPLTAIALSVHTLLSRTPDVERRSRGRRQLEAIARSAGRMKHQVHDLVDAAAIEAGRLTLERQPQPVGPIVAEAMQLIAPLAGARRLTLECAPGPGDPAGPTRLTVTSEPEACDQLTLEVNVDRQRYA